MKNQILQGSCFDLIDTLPDESVDLIVTSPPYADMKSYGDGVNVLHPDHYVDWILPLFYGMKRVLKPSGSLIFNVGEKVHKKQRHPYVYQLICDVISQVEMPFYDRYFWHKVGIPNGSKKRLNNFTEMIMHFCKDTKHIKWNMDDVREPYKEISVKRYKSKMNTYETLEDGTKVLKKQSMKSLNPKGKTPDGLLKFPNNSNMKGNPHPAPFSKELPMWFIKALTDEGDLVLDPFMGSGTTAMAAKELERNYLGFELNPTYIEYAEGRLNPNNNVDTFFE